MVTFSRYTRLLASLLIISTVWPMCPAYHTAFQHNTGILFHINMSDCLRRLHCISYLNKLFTKYCYITGKRKYFVRILNTLIYIKIRYRRYQFYWFCIKCTLTVLHLPQKAKNWSPSQYILVVSFFIYYIN